MVELVFKDEHGSEMRPYINESGRVAIQINERDNEISCEVYVFDDPNEIDILIVELENLKAGLLWPDQKETL